MSFRLPRSTALSCSPVLASAEMRRKSGSSAWSRAMSSNERLMSPTAFIRDNRSSFVSALISFSRGCVEEEEVEAEAAGVDAFERGDAKEEEWGEGPVPSPGEEEKDEDEKREEAFVASPGEEQEDEGGRAEALAVVAFAAALFSPGAAPFLSRAAAGALRDSLDCDGYPS